MLIFVEDLVGFGEVGVDDPVGFEFLSEELQLVDPRVSDGGDVIDGKLHENRLQVLHVKILPELLRQIRQQVN